MAITARSVLLVLAIIAFFLGALEISLPRINMIAVGLLLLSLALLFG